jgi:3-carboxy-cis,cis-muconate cycloisomerase
LLAPMLSSAAMRAVCDDGAYLQHMLDFEQHSHAPRRRPVSSRKRSGPDREGLNKLVRSRRLAEAATDPAISRSPDQGAHRQCRQGRR